MNRKQRIEMILQVLLFPFLELPSQQEDLLCTKAKTYQKMVTATDNNPEYRQAYERSRQQMQCWLERRIHPDRLSEIDNLLEMFYPEEELRAHLNYSERGDLDEYYINVLFRIATEFITLHDGRPSIRMWDETDGNLYFEGSSGLYKVELWSVMSRIITPDVLIVSYFVANKVNSLYQLSMVSENLSLNDSLFDTIAKRGIAETHMHLSAGMSYLAVWQVVTDPASQKIFTAGAQPILQTAQREEQQTYYQLLICGWLRLLMAYYLQNKEIQEDICDYYAAQSEKENDLEEHILEYVLNTPLSSQFVAYLYEYIIKRKQEYMHCLSRLCPANTEGDLDALLRGPYACYRDLPVEPELILLYSALKHIQEHPRHCQFIRIFLNYIRLKNSYFSDKMQIYKGHGLAFFSRYFKAATSALWQSGLEDRKKVRLVYQAAFQNQLSCPNLQKLEVKISPPISRKPLYGTSYSALTLHSDKWAIAKQLYQVFSAYLYASKKRQMNDSLPTIGVVYHFIKNDIHHPSDQGCWVYETDSQGPTDAISLLRMQCMRFLKALWSLIAEVPMLDQYVVGIDAASQELKAEPWVYAPVYRFARRCENMLPVHPITGQRMQGLGLTYHVGEDYTHILTGLRHIYEVITYFGYKPGDRLGHAIALQVDIANWITAHETTPVPALDRLEDLLWLWHLCEEAPEELGKYRFGLESDLMKLATDLFVNTKGLSPYVLWQAYLLKFENLDHSLCKEMKKIYLKFPDAMFDHPPRTFLPTQRSFYCHTYGSEQVWDAEKLLLTNYCPIYMRHFNKPILVSTTPENVHILRAVQHHIKKKIQAMGIYIEANPSSNISIGDIGSLRDLPITQLHSTSFSGLDAMSILLSINSDDPLVFNTNVENELALVYHTLIYQGYGREEVLNWIDKIRQNGLDSSFICAKKDSTRLRGELEQILNRLRYLMTENIASQWSVKRR